MIHCRSMTSCSSVILSVSRRTDIPAFFFDSFLAALQRGSIDIPNPYNPKQVRHLLLTSETVDALVFWTKDPKNLLDPRPLLDRFPWVALCTLTPYGSDWEPAFPDKNLLVDRFCRLADRIGNERILWRYDPIILTPLFTVDQHLAAFESLACRLNGSTTRCIVSFVTPYRRNRAALERIGWIDPEPGLKMRILSELQEVAKAYGMELTTCADPQSPWPGACIDNALLSRLSGKELSLPKDPYQRPACLCARSVDIGSYGTCKGGCLYCYATSNSAANLPRSGQIYRKGTHPDSPP